MIDNRMGPLDKALMATPLDNPERNKLREVVRGSPAQLFNKCRRFLTLGAVYAERETFARKRDVIPTYAQWMTSQGISPKDAKREAARARAEWAAIIAGGQQ